MTDAPKRIWVWKNSPNGEFVVSDDDQPYPTGSPQYILASEVAALIREAKARGMERAAKVLDKRIESLVADHGSHEWDTNVTNLPEWVETATEELEAQAAAIRAAKATP